MKILLADDDPLFQHLISSFLKAWGHEVILAKDGSHALEILQGNDAPTLAILDWMMPGLDGIEVCRRVRAIPERPYTYLISFTSRSEKQNVIEALEAGFDDFLAKPVDVRELKARLWVGRRIIELQERLMLACQVTRFEATHDSLTGLWNRGAILEFLRGQMAKAKRGDKCLAILLIDVDHFKAVNDTHGHLMGDLVLKHLAQMLMASVRTYDWAGRYGGEEFLIIAPDCPADAAYALAERLRLTIAAKPITTGDKHVCTTVSIGVATTNEMGTGSREVLLHAADMALYMAKRNGRNRVERGAECPGRLGRAELINREVQGSPPETQSAAQQLQ
jgi:two-component system, cell cycle response regulator